MRIHGEEIRVKARIRSIDAYSGHADRDELVDWARPMLARIGTLLLVHGEPRSMAGLTDALVLAAWNHPDAGLYLQGKLYDYLAVGRPIVAESSQPELSSILQRTGAGVTIAPGSVDSMVDVIDRLARDGSVSERSRDDEAVSYYSAAQAAGRLAAIFAKVGAS